MEKLRSALDQARSERAQSAQKKTGKDLGGRPSGATQVADDIQRLWAALPEGAPDPAHLTRNRVVTHSYSREATVFDILRTKMVLQMRKNGWRKLAITSATPTCGKTTVTCNMAMGLSRQNELRAVVMDLDLRNPSMSQMLGLTPSRDVTRVLDGEIPFEEQALRIRESVAVSLAKSRAMDPTRFLLGQTTDEALARIEAEYAPDLMIFDTAPVMVSDDTRAFLGKVDCAMIVACAERTTVKQIDTCEREIAEQTNVLGVVLNQTRFMDRDESGYGYGYGYGQ